MDVADSPRWDRAANNYNKFRSMPILSGDLFTVVPVVTAYTPSVLTANECQHIVTKLETILDV